MKALRVVSSELLLLITSHNLASLVNSATFPSMRATCAARAASRAASSASTSAKHGGDLGFFGPGKMQKAFEVRHDVAAA